jgi:3-hydroxyacyl-CoA dehydrogenase
MAQTIGFIGSGAIGSTLARLAVAAGLNVVLSNSRGPDTLAELVAELGDHARAATPAGHETLAWSDANYSHDAYCHSGTAQRQKRRVDGTGQRRALPQVIMALTLTKGG